MEVGRTEVRIFQDKRAIPLGTDWKKKIYAALGESSFIIPIVTPAFLQSKWCCQEVLYFREREKALGRGDLIFPFIYLDIAHVDPDWKDDCHDKAAYELLGSRQRFDLHDLIDHDVASQAVRERLAYLAKAVHNALRRTLPVTDVSPSLARSTTVIAAPVAVVSPLPLVGVIRDHEDAPELVRIPAGRFTMGVPPEEEEREKVSEKFRGQSQPQQAITIARPFWLGRYPITRGQFARFVADTSRTMPNEASTFEPDAKGEWRYELRSDRDWRNPGFQQTDDHPVVCVSYDDAMAYIEWLKSLTGIAYRLASEAEWEYAARAGRSTSRFWGDGRAEAVRYAKVADRSLMARMSLPFDSERFFDGDSGYAFTAPVGQFESNAFDLHDMLGNVWEWTADCRNEDLKSVPNDGSARVIGDCSWRALRGGSWFNYPGVVRAGVRGW